MITTGHIVAVFIAINFIAFAAFGLDKIKAEEGKWRIPEATLLQLAFFGGTLGAYIGRAAFRHKTRKQPFSSNLHTIAVLQVAGLLFLAYWQWGYKLGLR